MLPSDPEHDQYDDGLVSENMDELLNEKDIMEEYESVDTDANTIIVDDDYDGQDEDDEDQDDTNRPSYIAELKLHNGEPSYALAINPRDNSTMASAGGDDKTVIFVVKQTTDSDEPIQVEIVGELVGHTDTVEHVKFSHDGKYLATGSLDGTVRIWSEERSLVHVLEASSEITWINWHPNGPVIAAGCSDGNVWMWSANNGKCMQVLTGNGTTSTCGSFGRDGKTLISGGDGTFIVWNPKDGSTIVAYCGNIFPKETVISIGLHPNQPIASLGFSEGSLAVVHLSHYQILSVIKPSEQAIEYVDFAPNNPIMLSAGLNGLALLLDSNNYNIRNHINHPQMSKGVTSGALLMDGSFALGSITGTIGIWDMRSGEMKQILELGQQAVDKSHLMNNGEEKEENQGNGEEEQENAIYDLIEIKNQRLLLASFDDGNVRIYRF